MNFKLPNKNNESLGVYIIMVILLLALTFGVSCFLAWIGMLLWNWVIVGEFGLFTTKIGFWPMWGLIMLCGILFRSHNTNTNTTSNN